MKRQIVLTLSLALGLAQLAHADESAAPDAQSLGMIEGILDKCAEVDPEHAARYHEQAKRLIEGRSDAVVAEVRKSDEYQRARDAVAESFRATVEKKDRATAEKDALKACKTSLAPRQ